MTIVGKENPQGLIPKPDSVLWDFACILSESGLR